MSEVAGMPMPRTEGAMIEHFCFKIGSSRAVVGLKGIMNVDWGSRTYPHICKCRYCSLDAGLVTTVISGVLRINCYLSVDTCYRFKYCCATRCGVSLSPNPSEDWCPASRQPNHSRVRMVTAATLDSLR